MFAKILTDAGFVFNEGHWTNPQYQWVRVSGISSKGSVSLRGFLDKPKSLSKPEMLPALLEQYIQSKLFSDRFHFAMDTLREICDALNAEFVNAQFFVDVSNTGMPALKYKFVKDASTEYILAFYNNFMPFVHEQRAKDFSMSYPDIAVAYMGGPDVVEQPIVKCTEETLNIFSTPKGMRNPDLWRLHSVIEMKTHEIWAEFPSCPDLLKTELKRMLQHTYIEFICSRKG